MSKKLNKLKAELKIARRAMYDVEADDPDAEELLERCFEYICSIRDKIIKLSIEDAKYAEEVRRLCE